MAPTPYVYPPKDQPRIIVLGSIIQDLDSYMDRSPKPGETVPGKAFISSRGGKGSNQSVAAARLGGAVSVIGRVGKDMFADDNLQGSKENAMNVDGVEKSSTHATGTALITVDAKGENTTVVSLGANAGLDEKLAKYRAYVLRDADVCITQATVCNTTNKQFLELARSKGVLTICNHAPTDKCEDRELMALVDIFCVNQHEASFITGNPVEDIESAKAAAIEIRDFGPKRVLVTIGADGVVFTTSKGDAEHVPCTKCEVVDTTGAGDCFIGSLAYLVGKIRHDRNPEDSEYACLEDDNFREAVRRAAFVASLSVTEKGGTASYWRKEEILRKYPNFFKS